MDTHIQQQHPLWILSSKPSHLNVVIIFFAYLENCKQRQHEPEKTAAEPTRRIMKCLAKSHSQVYGKYNSSYPNEDKSYGSLALNPRH